MIFFIRFLNITTILLYMGWKLIIITFLLILPSVYSATIQGEIYDLELNKLTDVIIEINSQPKQTFVAKNSTYFFDVPIGNYLIIARQRSQDLITQELIKLKDNGNYNIDLILMPSFEIEQELLNSTEQSELDEFIEENNNYQYVYQIILVLFIICFLIVAGFYINRKLKLKRKYQKEENNNNEKEDILTKKLIDFIKKQDGRVTQKDIRKQFTYSEAKISLIITELESKGVIKKIKKGRGNIIILK